MAIREPQQKRSRETRGKILRAAEKLFSEKGYADVNTNLIAREAGVSVGAFYHHFDSKKDVLLAVLEDFGDLSLSTMEEALMSHAPDFNEEQVVLELVKLAVHIHVEQADIMKTINDLRYTDPEIDEYTRRNLEKNEKAILMMLKGLETKRGIEIRNAPTKARIVMTLVECLCHENFFYGLGIEREEFVRELKDLIIGYLDRV